MAGAGFAASAVAAGGDIGCSCAGAAIGAVVTGPSGAGWTGAGWTGTARPGARLVMRVRGSGPRLIMSERGLC